MAVTAIVAACGEGEEKHKRKRSGGGGDATAPTVLSVTPTDGTTIGNVTGNDTITIVFSESMDPDSHVIGGDLATSDDGGTWETTTVTNDTLVLIPASATTLGGSSCETHVPCWSANDSAVDNTVTLDATDIAGNPAATVSTTYRVDNDGDGVEDWEDEFPGDENRF